MRQKFYVKIFKLNENHYELKGKNFKEKVEIILKNHKRHIYASDSNIKVFDTEFEFNEIDGYEFASYCYNHPIEKHYWRMFLPDFIGQNQNFNITKFSYVLFIHYNNSVYCVIGGTGNSVIKSFINTSFGIDVYSRLAKPSEDIVIEIKSRSIANNVSLQTTTFNYNQTVSDTIEFSEIPSVMKIIIRDDLKEGFFKPFGLSSSQSILEIGSYFCLRKSISFEELLALINSIDDLVINEKPVDLSFFKKIEKVELYKALEDELIGNIIKNVKGFSYEKSNDNDRKDVDIVHPTKLDKFYECDTYKIKYKNSRGTNDISIDDRQLLYVKSIEHIYNRLEDDFNDFNITREIFKSQIIGMRNDKEVTFGTFLNHIIAEITFQNKKYFKIDKEWYSLKDVFLQKINETASEYYQRYELDEPILKPWLRNMDERAYNCSHRCKNSYVLDRLLIDNIELCDILSITENKIYFIHVKDGFDVKLRDCYIQVVLASKRLSIDLKDKNGTNYLIPTLNKYNKSNPENLIDISFVSDSIIDKSLDVVFVLAYKNKSNDSLSAIEKIHKSNSNIAKYSIVNAVKEMNDVFEFKLIDISTIKSEE